MFFISCLDSIWRHPFTAEDPFVSKWCNTTFLQICSDEEQNATSWMAWGCVHLQQIFIFGWTIPLCLAYQEGHYCLLTQVSALDSTVVKRDAEIVARFPQLRNGDSIRTTDYPRFIVILPVTERTNNTKDAITEAESLKDKHGCKADSRALLLTLHWRSANHFEPNTIDAQYINLLVKWWLQKRCFRVQASTHVTWEYHLSSRLWALFIHIKHFS